MESKPYPEESIKIPRFEEHAGFYTTSKRSSNMAKIKAKNSLPELKLRKALWAKRIRFRIHPKNIPGKPDLIINKYRLAIFVDGDFWHGYNWEEKKTALKTNSKFWIPKIERNMQRDQQVNQQLNAKGYTVMRFWEHDIEKKLASCVNQVLLYVEAAKTAIIPRFDG
ncbi:endonuclease [Pedobacter sp. Leaf216]|uniref:very short patch repair endonuclease n=1 Tax=Pedobacter sp. Leaf216 TaxID=1735684 RepID=UPI0006FEC457|nr:very short patch repair endonuclease [Pedobacter sp. Leaf216]KQM78102.1 endonuclease [Pedobacter sp. Leaf216]